MIPDRLISSFRRIGRGSLGVIRWGTNQTNSPCSLGPGLEVVEEDVHALAVYSIILYDDAAASYDLAGVAVLVDFAEAGPGTEELGVSDLKGVSGEY